MDGPHDSRPLAVRAGAEIARTPYSVVYEAWLPDGTEAVLKRRFVGDETRTEIEALQAYGGDGAVRLLDADAPAGTLVLERVRPGTPVAAGWRGDDEGAARVIADVMRRLWRSSSGAFREVSTLAGGFERVRGLPLLDEGRRTFLRLVATSPSRSCNPHWH